MPGWAIALAIIVPWLTLIGLILRATYIGHRNFKRLDASITRELRALRNSRDR